MAWWTWFILTFRVYFPQGGFAAPGYWMMLMGYGYFYHLTPQQIKVNLVVKGGLIIWLGGLGLFLHYTP